MTKRSMPGRLTAKPPRPRYFQNEKTGATYLVQKCYCGGETVLKKTTKYRKEHWEIVNCFPYNYGQRNKLKFLGYKKPEEAK
jgi:hypothetical protein